MKKIDKLTKDQEIKLDEYRQKWLDIGRSIEPIDRDKTIESIKWLYKYGKKDKEPYMWFCDSPMQIQLILNDLKTDEFKKLLGNNLKNNLWDHLRDNLRVNLWNNLRNNLGDNLWGHLMNNLWDNLEINLGANLWSNLLINLWDNLKSNKLTYNSFFSPNTESNWVGFYDFILNELFPEKKEEFKTFNNECIEFYKNVYHIVPFENICFISERPIELNLNSEGKLHHHIRPAIKFKDGYELYFRDGVVTKKSNARIVQEKIGLE